MFKAIKKFFKKLEESKRAQVIFCVSFMTIIFIVDFFAQRYIAKNRIYTSGIEFLRTIDCAELIDKQGIDRVYRISFELRTEIPGEILVYCQNGETSKYYFEEYINTTTDFQKYTIDVTPVVRNRDVTECYLAFYGEYGSGVIPYIKGDITFEIIED